VKVRRLTRAGFDCDLRFILTDIPQMNSGTV
jgi:hypothetical protein